ncbi:MAG: myo-inositol 2-dehydrogenase / D-chiro-inositol 1-dehydrogenase [Solirubrobacteraceae bacterium]
MRIGVVGVGGHASATLFPTFDAAGLEVVATCARHLERAQAAAARWHAPHAFDDVGEMLASVDLDGVVVCVRPPDYGPLIEACVRAGKPVFAEKPAASTATVAHALAALSAKTGVPVVVGYMKRFAPAYRKAQAILQSEDFGGPSLAQFTFVMGQTADYADLRPYIIDNPVHHLDLARCLLGELTDLQAHVTELPGGAHAIAAIAKAASGAACTFNFATTASWVQRNEHVEIYGEGHAVSIENMDICTHRPPERPELTWRPNYTVGFPANTSPVITGFVPVLCHFRKVALNETENLSDMASAARTLALAERLCEIAGASSK